MSTEVTGGKGQRMDYSSTLAITTVDGRAPSDASRGPSGHSEQEECATASVNCRGAPNNETHKVDGLSVIRTQLGARGISKEGTEIIMASWRPATERQYNTHIQRWTQFCCRENINPLASSVAAILNFLTHNFHRGVGYDSINTARGALSALGILVEGCRAGNHPRVNRYLRGVFNLRPSKPRYAMTWDVKSVLQKIRTMEPLHSLSLKELSLKLVMLMALTQAARVQTLHLLLLENIAFGEDSVSVLLGGNIKHCRPKFNVRTIVFKAYNQDYRLCVFRNMKEYIERTERLRGDSKNADGKLLISYIKPHRSVSKDTVARWLKTMLSMCGIDTKRYTAGSIRPASVSVAKARDVPIDTIMAKAGWTQEATFSKYYNKHIQGDKDSFQEAVLGSV